MLLIEWPESQRIMNHPDALRQGVHRGGELGAAYIIPSEVWEKYKNAYYSEGAEQLEADARRVATEAAARGGMVERAAADQRVRADRFEALEQLHERTARRAREAACAARAEDERGRGGGGGSSSAAQAKSAAALSGGGGVSSGPRRAVWGGGGSSREAPAAGSDDGRARGAGRRHVGRAQCYLLVLRDQV